MRNHVFGLVAALTVFILAALPASAAHPFATLSDRGFLRNDGQTAVLEVVITCDTANNVSANASIQQPSGRSWASGSGWETGQCGANGTTTLFVPVTSQYAAFKSGPAEARVSVSHCTTTWVCHYTTLAGTVRLHK